MRAEIRSEDLLIEFIKERLMNASMVGCRIVAALVACAFSLLSISLIGYGGRDAMAQAPSPNGWTRDLRPKSVRNSWNVYIAEGELR